MKKPDDLAAGLAVKARLDLRTAAVTLKAGLWEACCFHAQQAAEKALKAYLAHAGVSFPYTHSIEELVDLACETEERFDRFREGGRMLTPYAVQVRYEEVVAPRRADAVAANRASRAICRFAFRLLPPSVTRAKAPQKCPKPRTSRLSPTRTRGGRT